MKEQKKCYWMYKITQFGKSARMIVRLTDEEVKDMEARGYEIVPYDPRIPVYDSKVEK